MMLNNRLNCYLIGNNEKAYIQADFLIDDIKLMVFEFSDSIEVEAKKIILLHFI